MDYGDSCNLFLHDPLDPIFDSWNCILWHVPDYPHHHICIDIKDDIPIPFFIIMYTFHKVLILWQLTKKLLKSVQELRKSWMNFKEKMSKLMLVLSNKIVNLFQSCNEDLLKILKGHTMAGQGVASTDAQSCLFEEIVYNSHSVHSCKYKKYKKLVAILQNGKLFFTRNSWRYRAPLSRLFAQFAFT